MFLIKIFNEDLKEKRTIFNMLLISLSSSYAFSNRLLFLNLAKFLTT